MQKLSFRSATIEDCKLILFFIKELAIYERMLDEVVTTEELSVYFRLNKRRCLNKTIRRKH